MKGDSLINEIGPGLATASQILDEAVSGADDGEIYLESVRSESFMFDDGRLKSASYDSGQGFGLRVVSGETTGYAHASEVSEASLRRAGAAAAAAKRGHGGKLALGPTPTNRRLYADVDPTDSLDFVSKTNLMAEIDAWCRARDPRVVQVSVSLAGSRTAVEIIRAGGASMTDARPLVRLNVSVTMEKDGRRETGSAGAGGRAAYDEWIQPDRWKGLAMRALRKAEINLEVSPRPCWRNGGGARAGLDRLCCCTKPSATASKATSTARARPSTPARSASRSRPKASPWSMMARS